MTSVYTNDFSYHIDVKQFTGHKDEINCVVLSKDCEILVTGSDDERIRVFNVQTGKMVVRLKGQQGAIKCVAISSDSVYIAGGSYDKTVIIYKTCDASTIHVLKGHLKSVESVMFSPTSQHLCSTSWDKTGIIWDVQTGHMLKVLQGHQSLVQCAAFSPCQRMLATGSWDHTVRIWPLQRRAGDSIHVLRAHKSNVHAVSFSCHSILATGGWDKKVIIWNPYTGDQLFMLEGHEGWIQALCFSHDGQMLVSSADDEMVKIWSLADRSCLKTLLSKTDSVSYCGFHPSGALIVSGSAIPVEDVCKASPLNQEDISKPPIHLEGEEILDKLLQNNNEVRPWSASIIKLHSQNEEQTGSSRRKLKSAGQKKPENIDDNQPKTIAIEKWLACSYQQL